ncbi:DUF934 domain-containing protein [Pseudohoeflea suaedae]|uniref:DUF934 domain-containing protein n=1 Tax=Pseudohoeflea suaedae TaxID=877384 RepID=A0A4V6PK10_9HYPH|nr:DUF934 domain-containing protein [Pseudohoeflea suaedae]TDH36302.1 DUF934 domain-containing protein [Pseudohoeflea suaedae]
MSTIVWNREGVVEDDRWATVEGESAFVSMDEALELAATGGREIGVLVEPADDPARLKPILDRLAIIALDFPAFNDGRAFSHAALLRDRLGYGGEIRGVGDVLLDQVPFMLRVGIDSVETAHEPTARRLTEMRLPGVDLHYQPAALKAEPTNTYSWRRRAAV